MTQQLPARPAQGLLELTPRAPVPQTVNEAMVAPNIQPRCVELLAELLEAVAHGTATGGQNER